jgi:hypothetical protein
MYPLKCLRVPQVEYHCCIQSNDEMINELGRMWKEAATA